MMNLNEAIKELKAHSEICQCCNISQHSESIQDAIDILTSAQHSGLTKQECVLQILAAGGIKDAKAKMREELGGWPK